VSLEVPSSPQGQLTLRGDIDSKQATVNFLWPEDNVETWHSDSPCNVPGLIGGEPHIYLCIWLLLQLVDTGDDALQSAASLIHFSALTGLQQ
jgi:hypothetical protein